VDAAVVVVPLAAASAGFGAQEFSVTLRDPSDIEQLLDVEIESGQPVVGRCRSNLDL
jgi:hypothetical protein